MKLLLFTIAIITLAAPARGFDHSIEAGGWNAATPVYEVLRQLGDEMPAHYIGSPDERDIKKGEEIVRYGSTVGPDNRRAPRQSRYFVCTSCHNLRREDPDLRVGDPEARLDYVMANGLGFLPATTFYGLVNRRSWFNDDYVKKYGTLAAAANKDLVKAIQLCATECSMGRELNDWELRAVLAYFRSLELKLGDLNLTDADWSELRRGARQPERHRELIAWLKGFYLKASPATFASPPEKIPPPPEGPAAYQATIQRGKAIYELSCRNCHKPGGVTSFTLADSPVTYRLLNDHTTFSAHFSIYNAIRNGIKASPGKGYMPNFTLERLSDSQIEDLRAFVHHQATR